MTQPAIHCDTCEPCHTHILCSHLLLLLLLLVLLMLQRLKSKWPLYASDFPMELRNYPRGASMPWHRDEQMYASPQWELIYTITNDSDSKTEWVDDEGVLHSEWTEPNSLVAVLVRRTEGFGWLGLEPAEAAGERFKRAERDWLDETTGGCDWGVGKRKVEARVLDLCRDGGGEGMGVTFCSNNEMRNLGDGA